MHVPENIYGRYSVTVLISGGLISGVLQYEIASSSKTHILPF